MSTPTAAVKAVQALRTAEQGALTGQHSYYTGSGRDADDGTERVKVKGKLKSKIVMIVLIAVFGGGAAFLGTSHSLLAPAIESLFTEATDTQYASANLRTVKLVNYMLNTNKYVSTNWSGAAKYKNFNNSFKKRLANNNITIETDASGAKFLQFTQTVNDTTVTKNIYAADFADTLNTDVDFRDKFQSSTRGRVATFFDRVANTLYDKLKLRNIFGNYDNTGNTDLDTQNFDDTMSSRFDDNTSSVSTNNTEEQTTREPIRDKDGNIIDYKDVTEDVLDTTSSSGKSDNTDIDTSITKAQSTFDTISNTVQKYGGYACTAMRVGSMIAVAVAANEIYQSINYFMGNTENISKTKAGYGDHAALTNVLTLLATASTIQVNTKSGAIFNPATGTGSKLSSFFQSDYVTLTGTPLESTGMQKILTGSSNTNTSSLFSLDRTSNSLMSNLNMSKEQTRSCLGLDALTSGISLLKSSIIAISVVVTGPVGIAAAVVDFVKENAFNIALSVSISVALGFLIPTIAQALYTNIFDIATGIAAGELFAKGASAANTKVGRTGSQSIADQETAVVYNHTTNTILALDAEIERNNHSPFDITNKNTFLGSIAYSFLPITTSGSVTGITGILSNTAKSISSILGGAYAEGDNSSYMTTYGDCPSLETIGAVGDMYCNPITVTDTSTIDITPDDEAYQKALNSCSGDECLTKPNSNLNCTNDECTIIEDSNLAKYISYCDGRDSPFGFVDQNILNATNFTTSSTVLDGLIGSIPIVGDIANLWNSKESGINIDWSTGQKCVATNTVGDLNYEFWQTEGKYYQRYVEDMRLLDMYGDSDATNPVAVYEEAYAAAHPTDNSYTGYLSRISGLTKENIEIVLAFADYYEYLDNYNPTTRIAFFEYDNSLKSGPEIIASFPSKSLKFQDPSFIKETTPSSVIARKCILYENLRDRNFVA